MFMKESVQSFCKAAAWSKALSMFSLIVGCFIAKCVCLFLLAQVIYFAGGLKRSTSSFHESSVRVQGTMNVDSQGGQRAFDQLLYAALRIGHRGGLVNAQRFLEQINRLIARAVERLDKLLHPLTSLRESVRSHRLELCLELLG